MLVSPRATPGNAWPSAPPDVETEGEGIAGREAAVWQWVVRALVQAVDPGERQRLLLVASFVPFFSILGGFGTLYS